jgi:hypothetical protein
LLSPAYLARTDAFAFASLVEEPTTLPVSFRTIFTGFGPLPVLFTEYGTSSSELVLVQVPRPHPAHAFTSEPVGDPRVEIRSGCTSDSGGHRHPSDPSR